MASDLGSSPFPSRNTIAKSATAVTRLAGVDLAPTISRVPTSRPRSPGARALERGHRHAPAIPARRVEQHQAVLVAGPTGSPRTQRRLDASQRPTAVAQVLFAGALPEREAVARDGGRRRPGATLIAAEDDDPDGRVRQVPPLWAAGGAQSTPDPATPSSVSAPRDPQPEPTGS